MRILLCHDVTGRAINIIYTVLHTQVLMLGMNTYDCPAQKDVKWGCDQVHACKLTTLPLLQSNYDREKLEVYTLLHQEIKLIIMKILELA